MVKVLPLLTLFPLGFAVVSPPVALAQPLAAGEQGFIASLDRELDFRTEQIPALIRTGWEYCQAKEQGMSDDDFREQKVSLIMERGELPMVQQLGIAKMVNLIVGRGRRYLCPEPILEGEQTYYHPLVHVVWEFRATTSTLTCSIINISDHSLETINVYFSFYNREGDQVDERLAAAYDLLPKAEETIWVQSPVAGIIEARIDRVGGF